jgi:dihydrofolate reductase
MKISLVILESLDGVISKGNEDKLDWGSKDDKDFFKKKVNKAGFMIMGSTTYETMPKVLFKDKFTLVLAYYPEDYEEEESSEVHFFGGDPESELPIAHQAVKFLEEKGVKHAILAGGGSVNGLFLQAGLVDDIYITIAPKVFGSGVRVFGNEDLDIDLRLKSCERVTENEVLLHYEVES